MALRIGDPRRGVLDTCYRSANQRPPRADQKVWSPFGGPVDVRVGDVGDPLARVCATRPAGFLGHSRAIAAHTGPSLAGKVSADLGGLTIELRQRWETVSARHR